MENKDLVIQALQNMLNQKEQIILQLTMAVIKANPQPQEAIPEVKKELDKPLEIVP